MQSLTQTLRNTRIKPYSELYPTYLATLDAESKQIRVVHLKPGRRNDPIEVTLRIMSLLDDPVYEALSYVWGSPKDPVNIKVNGWLFSCTQNLAHALLDLRSETEERILWIDAIAINQECEPEKNQQVAMMRDIYQKASEVLVYFNESQDSFLGETDLMPRSYLEEKLVQEVDAFPEQIRKVILLGIKRVDDGFTEVNGILDAFELIRILGEDHHVFELPWHEVLQSPNGELNLILREAWFAALDSLCKILEARWWHRVWTLQEAIVPRKSPKLCIGGSNWIDLDDLFKAAFAWQKHLTGCKLCGALGLQRVWSRPRDGHMVSGMQVVFELLTSLANMGTMRERFHSHKVHTKEIIKATDTRQATVQVDLVWGVWGMIQNSMFRPTGGKTKEDEISAFILLQRQVFEDEGSLEDLACEPRYVDGKLPSWVRDWSAHEMRNMYVMQSPGSFSASGTTRYKRIEDAREDGDLLPIPSLAITVLHLCNVGDVSPVLPGNPSLDKPGSITLSQRQELQKFLVDIGKWAPFDSKYKAHEEKLRTSAWAAFFRVSPDLIDLKVVDSWYAKTKTLVPRDPAVYGTSLNTEEMAYEGMINRKVGLQLFECGRHLGAAKPGIRTGDKIVIAEGCPVPLIVRQESKAVGSPHRLVSACYLDGYMHGRGLKAKRPWSQIHLV